MTEKELIGIFDSGVGGLSILKKLLPSGGHYLYFGDTKNVPYGNKTKEEIINFTRNIIEFFISKGAKRVVMACNTSSALAYDTLEKEFGTIIKIHPLIQTVAPYIAREGNIIGIMSTCATAQSKTYTKEILKANDKAVVYELGCPDFVKIVEERLYDKKESVEYVKKYLDILLDKGCEKIVLGCTHYPYLTDILTRFAPKDIFIDPAVFMTNIFKNNICSKATVEYFVSGDPEEFRKSAKLFIDIKENINRVQTDRVLSA